MLGTSWLGTLRIRNRKLSTRGRRSRRRTARYRMARLGQVESLESRTLLTPVIASFDLYADTGTPGDYVTADPRVTGTVTGGSEVEFDYNGDGIAEESGVLDSDGLFVQDPSGYIGLGPVTVYVRGGEMDLNLGYTVYGDWVGLSYTWEQAPPQVTSFQIVNPPDGHPSVTLDGLLSGTVEYTDGNLGSVSVEFDYTEDGFADDYTTVAGDGTFTWDMDNSAGFGIFNVQARAIDTHLGSAGDWVSLAVSYIAPPMITSFSVIEVDWHEFQLSGTVDYYDPTLLTIQVSGVTSGTMYADFYGQFWDQHTIDTEGYVYVVAKDEFGRESSTWTEYVLLS